MEAEPVWTNDTKKIKEPGRRWIQAETQNRDPPITESNKHTSQKHRSDMNKIKKTTKPIQIHIIQTRKKGGNQKYTKTRAKIGTFPRQIDKGVGNKRTREEQLHQSSINLKPQNLRTDTCKATDEGGDKKREGETDPATERRTESDDG
ncbi:hypothetical protein U1Q18_013354 [Sarracenia purpurea var. burkii]